MDVDPASAKFLVGHEDKDVYFCSSECQQEFPAEPGRYLTPTSEATPAPVAGVGTRNTCPMHPQVVRDAPGPCPICGMALAAEQQAKHRFPQDLDDDSQRRERRGERGNSL